MLQTFFSLMACWPLFCACRLPLSARLGVPLVDPMLCVLAGVVISPVRETKEDFARHEMSA